MSHRQQRDAYDIGIIKANTLAPMLKFLCDDCVHRMIDVISSQEQPTELLQGRYKEGFLSVYQRIKGNEQKLQATDR